MKKSKLKEYLKKRIAPKDVLLDDEGGGAMSGGGDMGAGDAAVGPQQYGDHTLYHTFQNYWKPMKRKNKKKK
jgi:hypothetical protein